MIATLIKVHCKYLSLQIYEHAVEKATLYLSSHVPNVKSLYVRAIAAYALTLIDLNNHHAVMLYGQLKKVAKVKGDVQWMWFL